LQRPFSVLSLLLLHTARPLKDPLDRPIKDCWWLQLASAAALQYCSSDLQWLRLRLVSVEALERCTFRCSVEVLQRRWSLLQLASAGAVAAAAGGCSSKATAMWAHRATSCRLPRRQCCSLQQERAAVAAAAAAATALRLPSVQLPVLQPRLSALSLPLPIRPLRMACLLFWTWRWQAGAGRSRRQCCWLLQERRWWLQPASAAAAAAAP
jgi:hypothetical protein